LPYETYSMSRFSWTCRLNLFGPVLFYDMIRTARRRRHAVLRLGYAFLLVYVLAVLYLITVEERMLRGREDLSNQLISESGLRELNMRFFGVFMAVQMLTVLILTPAYTGGAVAAEKERQTLYDLLATDLRNREIVLSLLVSRLANLGLVIITGIPILGFLEFLGGLDPQLVLTGFAMIGLTTLSLGALGILNSVLYARPRTAILRTYFWILFYLALSGLSWLLLLPDLKCADFPSTESWQSTVTVVDAVHAFNVGNPVAALIRLAIDLNKGIPLDALVWDALIPYAWFHGILALVCVLWSIRRVRVLALQQFAGSDTGSEPQRRSAFHFLPFRMGIGAWPMLWKETVIAAAARRRWWSTVGFGIAAAVCVLPVIHLAFWIGNLSALPQWIKAVNEIVTFWIRCMTVPIGSLMLLLVGIRAAGSITGERALRTLDGLLTTPLEPRGILFAKWWAAILSPRRTGFWLVLIWVLGMVTGALHPVAFLALALAWTVYAGFMASLGLYFSVASKSTQRAAMWTLVSAILVFGAFILLAFDFSSGRFEAYGVVPVVALAIVPSLGREYPAGTANGFVDFSSVVVGLFLWGGIAVALGLLAGHRFRVEIGRRRKSIGPVNEDGQPMAYFTSAVHHPLEPEATRNSRVRLTDLFPVSFRFRDWFFGLHSAWPAAVPGLLIIGWYAYQSSTAAKFLQSTIAQTDRLDPGWRLEELAARREQIPDEKNSALQLIEADRSLPPFTIEPSQWPMKRLDEAIRGNLLPEEQLPESRTQVLTVELRKLAVTVRQARRLAGMPYGRFPDNEDANMAHFWSNMEKVRRIAGLLRYDILLLAQERKVDQAIDSCRALINAGRSLRSEPSLMAQYYHVSLWRQPVRNIERVLAQGEPSEAVLVNLQHLLETEAGESLLVKGLRGERAALFQLLQDLQNGKTGAFKEMGLLGAVRKDQLVNPEDLQLLVSALLPYQRAALLNIQNQLVEIAKLPLNQQRAAANQLSVTLRDSPLLVRTSFSVIGRMDTTFLQASAEIRCALVMVAVERFRLAHGHWPGALQELLPQFIDKIPDDPYTGSRLLYRLLLDGVVIYSVGPDGVDNGGLIRAKARNVPAADIGVRLWDPSHRRQPASNAGLDETNP